MGFADSKYMIVFMISILFVTHIFGYYLGLSPLVDSASPLTSKFNIQNENLTELTMSDEGKNLYEWSQSFNQSVESDSVYDFSVYSWGIIKTPFLVFFDFLFAPATLTYHFIHLDNLTFLWWIPYMIGMFWFFGLIITAIQMFTGRN